MASGNSETGGVSSAVSVESEERLIDKEIRENGVIVDLDHGGYALLKFMGVKMEVSPKVARGRFVVDETTCQPFGVLQGGVTALVAENIVSTAGVYGTKRRIAGVELNVNHLRAVPVGYQVTAIGKPLMQGSRIQVWEVKFEAESPKNELDVGSPELYLAAVARVTILIGIPLDPATFMGAITAVKPRSNM